VTRPQSNFELPECRDESQREPEAEQRRYSRVMRRIHLREKKDIWLERETFLLPIVDRRVNHDIFPGKKTSSFVCICARSRSNAKLTSLPSRESALRRRRRALFSSQRRKSIDPTSSWSDRGARVVNV